MFGINLNQVIILVIFHVSNCQRRITDGETVLTHKRYVVYLLKAATSTQYYDGWMCGGALVSTEYIVTSAACVTDVEHLYAIAGYNVYVPDENIDVDECTKAKKKKIVLICVPKTYELTYEVLEKWSYIDIAVVKVESPYNLNDEAYGCTYTPQAIKINYETKYQEPGIDAIVFGWGHKEKWRSPMDFENYNQPTLNYAPTLLQDKEECKSQYVEHPGMAEVIDSFMICTFEKGNINTAGDTIIKSPPTAQGCHDGGAQQLQALKSKGTDEKCENPDYKKNAKKNSQIPDTHEITYVKDNIGDIFKQRQDLLLIESARKDGDEANKTLDINKKNNNFSDNAILYNNLEDTYINHNYSMIDKLNKTNINSSATLRTRRSGICQNDHGGPLVTWVGAHEVLIGVASVFKITEEDACVGPYLYTSTQCNGAFLDCILSSNELNTDEQRRAICSSPASEKGFELIETHISWKDHPDGPADNEKNSTETKISTANSTNNTTSTNATTTNPNKSNKEKTKEGINYNHTTNLINTTISDPINMTITNRRISTTENPTDTSTANQTISEKERIYNYDTNLTTTTISDLFNVTITNVNYTETQNATNTATKYKIKSDKERNKDEINYNFTNIQGLIGVTVANLNTTNTTTSRNLINTITTAPSKLLTKTTLSTVTVISTFNVNKSTTIPPISLNQTNDATHSTNTTTESFTIQNL